MVRGCRLDIPALHLNPLCRIRDRLAAPSIGAKRNNPAEQTLGGVVDYLEHETVLEPATPTLAMRVGRLESVDTAGRYARAA